MPDPIRISDACRSVLEDLSRARHPTSRRPWLSIETVEGREKGGAAEAAPPLPAVDLIVG